MASRNCRTVSVALGPQSTAKANVILDAPDHDARIVAQRDEGKERWTFGVEDSAASLIKTTEADDVVELPDVPPWVETVLFDVGIGEVET